MILLFFVLASSAKNLQPFKPMTCICLRDKFFNDALAIREFLLEGFGGIIPQVTHLGPEIA